MTVGVDIKTAECVYENDLYVTMSIWDISSSPRFQYIYPTLFRGAAGCLIFFDNMNSNMNSNQLSNLEYWINMIRNRGVKKCNGKNS